MEGDYMYEQEIPLGPAAIGAFLRLNEYEVEFKQCFAGKGDDEYDRPAEIEADVYGFQLNMVNYLPVRSVVKKIKSMKPNAITIFGGPFIVSLSERILKNEPLFDFIVIGEGELTTLELLRALTFIINSKRDKFFIFKRCNSLELFRGKIYQNLVKIEAKIKTP